MCVHSMCEHARMSYSLPMNSLLTFSQYQKRSVSVLMRKNTHNVAENETDF